jgi:hypothetical protein
MRFAFDVIPIEDRQQALDRSRRITWPRRDVFPEDTPCVLKGTNESVLVGVVVHHTARQYRKLMRARADSFRWPRAH